MPGGFGPSDHASFYAAKVPVLFFFTGLHDQYHTPDDIIGTLNLDGAVRIVNLVDRSIRRLIADPQRIAYLPPAPIMPDAADVHQPFLGVQLDENSGGGMTVIQVVPDSPADHAQVKPGDMITKIGDESITDYPSLIAALRMHKPDDEITLTVTRDGKTIDLKLKLGSK